MKLVPRDMPPDVPFYIAVCPICGAAIVIDDIDGWEEIDGGDEVPSESGLHLNCSTEPDIASREWNDWHRSHWSMPYVDWMPLYPRVLAWLIDHYRFTETEAETQAKLDAWNAGQARKVEP